MKRDSRLTARSQDRERYCAAIEARTSEFDRSISEDEWQRVVDPLAALVLECIGGESVAEPDSPIFGNESLENAFKEVRDRILAFRGLCYSEEIPGIALIKRLAKTVAVRMPANLSSWLKVEELFHSSLNGAGFLDSIPTESIEDQVEELVRSTSTFQSGLTEPDTGESYLSEVSSQPSQDRVDRALKFGWTANRGWIGAKSRIVSELLYRSSHSNWLRWFESLPHAVIQQIVLNSIKDLEFLDALLEQKLNDRSPDHEDMLLPSIIWRIIGLWKEIEREINELVRVDFESAREMQSHWKGSELPARTSRLRALLESSHPGLEVAALFLRYLTPFCGPQLSEFSCIGQMRDQLFTLFEGRNQDDDILGLLVNPSKTSLAAAGVLAIRQPSPKRIDAVVEAYRSWLSAIDNAWYGRFGPEDRELLGVLAGVLARVPEPLDFARSIVDLVSEPSEGWKFNYDQWSRSVSRLSHAFMLISCTAVRIIDESGSDQRSVELMDLAWNGFHSMVENGSLEPRRGELQTAIAYIWACAGRALEDPKKKVLPAIKVFGDPRLALCAAENFKANGSISGVCWDSIRVEVEELLSFFHHARNFAADEEGPLRQRLLELTS